MDSRPPASRRRGCAAPVGACGMAIGAWIMLQVRVRRQACPPLTPGL